MGAKKTGGGPSISGRGDIDSEISRRIDNAFKQDNEVEISLLNKKKYEQDFESNENKQQGFLNDSAKFKGSIDKWITNSKNSGVVYISQYGKTIALKLNSSNLSDEDDREDESYKYHKEIEKDEDEIIQDMVDDELFYHLLDNRSNKSGEKNKQEEKQSFEKQKFLKASFFMRIGNFIGLSLRNNYFKDVDLEVIKAIDNNELYKVLEAEKNGYFLGRKNKKLIDQKLYEKLTTNPSELIEELVKRDVMLSYYDHLSLVLYSPEGKGLITGKSPEIYPHAKELFKDLLNKNNFLFANKNSWLRTLKNKDKFLSENNPLFYHDKMLSVCEKGELLIVKKCLSDFSRDSDVLSSISKTKLIEKMVLKIDLHIGNSIDLDKIVLDLPKDAQDIYMKLTNIVFLPDDIKILETNYQYEYDIVEKRVSESIVKYISVAEEFRNSLKSSSGDTAEQLLLKTLENILLTKNELKLFVNQQKLTDLSVTRRYTDSIRGDAGKPSIVQLKTAQQLKQSGELIDLLNENTPEYINSSSNDKNEKSLNKGKKIRM